MTNPPDPCSGVKSFSIGGRMVELRERCVGMTDEERRWRAQFLKDQILAPDEPRFVPEYYQDTTNVFRRLWKTPMRNLEVFLQKNLGKSLGTSLRHYIGKTGIMLGFVFIVTYYIKYHGNDWSYAYGPEWTSSQPRLLPCDKGYPNYRVIPLKSYADFGFSSSPFYKKPEAEK